MKFSLLVEIPDAVLEAEWHDAIEERETTQTLAEWRGEQPYAALNYLSGWFTEATVTIMEASGEAIAPDEASAAACACDLYADEFCLDDQAAADKSGTFGPRERDLLVSVARKLAAGGVPNFHPPDCDCGHEWCATRRALRA